MQSSKKEDICYATTNRQEAVTALSKLCNVMIVVGSVESSNSNRLKELAERLGCRSYLLDDPNSMQREWFDRVDIVGVTAWASAPEELVQQVVSQLKNWGASVSEEMPGVEENIVFALPKTLRDAERI